MESESGHSGSETPASTALEEAQTQPVRLLPGMAAETSPAVPHVAPGAPSVRSSSSDGRDAEKKKSSFETAWQGVLYAMVRGNSQGAILSYLILGSDVFQMLTFTFDFDIPWNFPFFFSNPSTVALIFGLVPFQVVFACSIVLIALVYINIIYVARSFLRGHFKMIWPLKTLRTVITTLVTIGYIPMLKLLLVPMNCVDLHWQEYPSVVCADNIPYALIATFALVALVPLCVLMAVVYFDQNPLSTSMLARYTGRLEGTFLAWKTVLTLVFVLTHGPYLKPFLLLFATGTVLGCNYTWLPYYNDRGIQVTASIHSFFFVMAQWGVAISFFNPRDNGSPYYTPIAAATALIGAVAGWHMTGHRLRKLKAHAESNIRGLNTLESTSTTELEISDPGRPRVKVFRTAREVPHCARSFYQLPLTPDTINRMRHVHECGLAEYPNSPLVYMAMSQFLLQVTNDPGRALTYIRKAKTMTPRFDVRFNIYSLERDILQNIETRNVGNQDAVDVVTYIQFQKSMAEAVSYHHETLKHLMDFWGRLDEGVADYSEFPTIVHNIAVAEQGAEDSYKLLLKHFPNSRSLVLSYARFLEFGKNDQAQAAEFYDLAEQLENGGGNRRDDDSSIRSGTRVSGSFGQSAPVDSSTQGQHRSFRTSLMNRKSPAAAAVSGVYLRYFAAAAVCIIVFFAVMRAQIDDPTVSLMLVTTIQQQAYALQRDAAYCRQMYIFAQANDTANYMTIANTLRASAIELEEAQHTMFTYLYHSTTHGDTTVDAYFDTMSIPVADVASSPMLSFATSQETRTPLDAVQLMIARMRAVAEVPMAVMQAPDYIEDIDFRALFESLRTVPSPLSANTPVAGKVAVRSSTTVLIGIPIWGASAIIGSFLLFYLGRCRISPAVRQVHKERMRAIDIFQEIPASVVHDVYLKLKQAFALEGTRAVTNKNPSASKAPTDQSLIVRVRANGMLIMLSVVLMFILGVVFAIKTRYDPLLYGNVYTAQTLAAEVNFFAQEMMAGVNDTVWAQSELRTRLVSLADKLQTSLYNLSITGENGEPPFISRFPSADPLINGAGGLIDTTRGYATLAAQIATDPRTVFARDDARFATLRGMLDQQLTAEFSAVYAAAATDASQEKTIYVGVVTALFIAVVLLFSFMLLVTTRMVIRILVAESRRNNAMILMIPPDVVRQVPAIHAFVTDSSRVVQEVFDAADAECVIGITAEGVIMSCERGSALGYGDQELIGLMITSVFPNAFGTAKKGKRVIAGLEKKITPFVTQRLSRVALAAHGKRLKFGVGVAHTSNGRVCYSILLFKPRRLEDTLSASEVASMENLDPNARVKLSRELQVWARDAVLLVDHTGSIRDMNNSAVRLLKRDARSLVSQPIHSVFPTLGHGESLASSLRGYITSGLGGNREHSKSVEFKFDGSGTTSKEVCSLQVRSMGDKGFLLFCKAEAKR